MDQTLWETLEVGAHVFVSCSKGSFIENHLPTCNQSIRSSDFSYSEHYRQKNSARFKFKHTRGAAGRAMKERARCCLSRFSFSRALSCTRFKRQYVVLNESVASSNFLTLKHGTRVCTARLYQSVPRYSHAFTLTTILTGTHRVLYPEFLR